MAILWQTNFDFAVDTDQEDWGSSPGDGMGRSGNWYCGEDPGHNFPSDIVVAANLNGSGRGFRQWMGDGHNSVSGSLQVDFSAVGLPSPMQELWVRWYCQYPTGFTWASTANQKMLFFAPSAGITAPGIYNGRVGLQSRANGESSLTWNNAFGGGTAFADGVKRCMEFHMKADSGGANGILQIWFDDVLIHDRSDIDYGNPSGGAGWTSFDFVENHTVLDNANGPLASNIVPFYLDNLAVGDSKIGPLGGGGEGGGQDHNALLESTFPSTMERQTNRSVIGSW